MQKRYPFFKVQRLFDRFGLIISGLCILHCVFTPFLLSAAPLVGVFFQSTLVHALLLSLALPVAYICLFRNQRIPVRVCGMVGAVFLVAGLCNEVFSGNELFVSGALATTVGGHTHGGDVAHTFTVLGGTALCVAHLGNLASKVGEHLSVEREV